jgi:hypothetical protein
MPTQKWKTAVAAAVLLGLISAGQAAAARLRYHYVPADTQGNLNLTTGERLTLLSGWEPYPCPPRPNQCVRFRHPCSGQSVQVPLALPADSTPRLEHRTNRVIYNYGSDTVQVHFLADGSVDVIYTSGLLRAP